MTIKLTHFGFFGICPVYIGDVETDCPFVVERHSYLRPLRRISEEVMAFGNWLRCWIDSDYEPYFPILFTGKLDQPFDSQ